MRAWKIVKVMAMAVLAAVVFGWVTKELWNWLVPSIFGLRAITFLEAVGLCLLGKILFGGFHKHAYGNSRRWKHRMDERWSRMSEEERERFRAGMKSRFECGFGRRERSASESAR